MTCRLALRVWRVKVAAHLDPPVYPPGESRPDLTIPLRPERRFVAGLRSVFAEAESRTRRTRRTAAVLALLLVVRYALLPDVRAWDDLAVGVAGCYLAARMATERWLRARQRAFEPQWLEAQSKVLAATWFEVVRLGVQEPPDAGTGTVHVRVYDLARGSDVNALLRRQAAERQTGKTSQVRVDFAYSRGAERHPALERVNADLAELSVTASGGARQGRVRFPLARYHAEPLVVGRNHGLPSRKTFWVLGPPVVSATAPRDDAPRSPIALADLESDP
jgi:hypothetical protein